MMLPFTYQAIPQPGLPEIHKINKHDYLAGEILEGTIEGWGRGRLPTAWTDSIKKHTSFIIIVNVTANIH